MPHIALDQSTGNVNIDQALAGLVGLFETIFPERIYGYFLEGSYADQTALKSSDIDLVILFKEDFLNPDERPRAERIATHIDQFSKVNFDLDFLALNEIKDGVPPTLKLGSQRLYGEPLPADFPLISVEDWGRERMHAAYWLINRVFGRPDQVTPPLHYPDPTDRFYGYANRTVRLPDGEQARSTRNLIRVVGWCGTALVAHLGGEIVPRKKLCHLYHRQVINDQWSPFLENVYTKCRTDWHYLIPTPEQERNELAEICRTALAFENYFLTVYKGFLLSELASGNESAIQKAISIQNELPLQDSDIVSLVKSGAKSL